MRQALGQSWPLGLGFLSPHSNYFADLPEGNIRNTDTGVYNSVMTMGVIGTSLLYLVPIVLLVGLVRRAQMGQANNSPLLMGGTIWLFSVLITSYSLGSLTSVSGLATVTVGLGVLLSPLVWPDVGPGSGKRGRPTGEG
jgi:hypothetical protein